MSGAMIILFVLVVNVMAAFIGTDTATGTGSFSSACASGGSNSTSNHADCEAQSKASFFSSVFGTTFTGFGSEAPVIVNALWGLTMGILLTVGVLLIVLAFIPLTSE